MAHDFLAQVITQRMLLWFDHGNGHDTFFTAKLAKQVYAFDIQEQALEKTSRRLQELVLIMLCYFSKVMGSKPRSVCGLRGEEAAIFNLGYLPSANKKHYHSTSEPNP